MTIAVRKLTGAELAGALDADCRSSYPRLPTIPTFTMAIAPTRRAPRRIRLRRTPCW